jgi:hypothetical protein
MRHPGLAALWMMCVGVTLLGLFAPVLFGLPIAPVLSIVAADAVGRRREAELQGPVWRTIHTAVMGLLVVASAVGFATLVFAPAELAVFAAVPAMALVFLASFVLGIRALVLRSPRRAAIPAVAAHVPTMMVMLQSFMTHSHGTSFSYRIVPWGAVLVLSSLASIVAMVGFDGRPASVVATAKVRR